MLSIFKDRKDAGQRLAARLKDYARRNDILILALPRGGVPVAYEVAESLHAPMDIFVVRKLGVPGQEELAMGAIATGNVRVINQDVINLMDISHDTLERVTAKEKAELERREKKYRGDRPIPNLEGKVIIIVDDGLATGATMRAAVRAVKAKGPARVIVAVPVGSAETCDDLKNDADEVICLTTPYPFFSIGSWYEDFSQTTDEEVRDLLSRAKEIHSE